jgi:ankyrin repeat protein
MANKVVDEVMHSRHSKSSTASTKGILSFFKYPSHSGNYAVRDKLMVLFPKILEAAYQSDKFVDRHDLLLQLQEIKRQMKPKKILKTFRSYTSFLQTQQDYWIHMDGIAKLDKRIKTMESELSKKQNTCKIDDLPPPENGGIETELSALDQVKRERENAKIELMKLLESKASLIHGEEMCDPFKPGPVGESPVHVCFLLGLTDIGKEVIEKYYKDGSTLSVAYKSDLLPLQTENPLIEPDEDPSDESKGDVFPRETGLYTGETLLHIAIVNEDAELVEYLLERKIKISSRATGMFFQPKWTHPQVKDLTQWQRFLSWIAGIDLKVEKFAVAAREENEYSACYYGEYPLSFAASIGSIQICRLLLSCKTSRANDRVDSIKKKLGRIGRSQTFVQHNKHWCLNSDGKTSRSSLWEFLNAIDYFGNTALHMAVLHRKKEVIDWLMTNEEAKASLEILNFDGYTPLTYAARLGYVDIFNHLLFKYHSRTGWTYGKVTDPS